jgi:hypothetical protein
LKPGRKVGLFVARILAFQVIFLDPDHWIPITPATFFAKTMSAFLGNAPVMVPHRSTTPSCTTTFNNGAGRPVLFADIGKNAIPFGILNPQVPGSRRADRDLSSTEGAQGENI